MAVVGARGRMGQRLVALAAEFGFEVAQTVDADGPGLEACRDALPDVIVDFSVAAQAERTLAFARDWAVPCVLGTTGLPIEAESALEAAGRVVAVVRAANFSVGVTALAHLVEMAARQLGAGWDIEIIESHHRLKVDAPSGTALALGDAAARGRGWRLEEVVAHGRQGFTGVRRDETIGMHAVRGGTVVGEHAVTFLGAGEAVTLEHRALDRDIFARGALRAAQWVVGGASGGPARGVYDMRHVLGFV
jgi:4-hydroxy-tetrahydrodipicolinate reductase